MLVWLSLGFSALQRAEIAEIGKHTVILVILAQVSVLFNEPKLLKSRPIDGALEVVAGFSALQRAEIAEIGQRAVQLLRQPDVSVLFNEPKLLKLNLSTLIAGALVEFQCSSTSRNC